MKTLRNQKTGEIKRLNDKEAHKLVTKEGYLGWSYIPKNVWKTEVRGPHSKTTPVKSKESKQNTNDSKSRKNVSK
jgi:hypothetical protein